jgi:hypothetical protein
MAERRTARQFARLNLQTRRGPLIGVHSIMSRTYPLEMAGTRKDESLFTSQRHHRINAHRSAGGDVARKNSHNQ